MWNWREVPVRAGVPARAVYIDATGPAPPEPAHAAQLCQPDIFSILDFTVCADRETLPAPTNAKIAITSQLLFSFFNIYSLQGIFGIGFLPVFPTTASGGGPCSSGQAGDYRPIYSGSTYFRLLGQLRPSSRGTPHELG